MIPKLCVPILKDPTSVAVSEDTRVMADFAQVKLYKHVNMTPGKRWQIRNYFFVLSTTDADECASPETHDCHPNAMCNNTEGSYVCRCLKGYDGDGRNCTGENSCEF